MNDVSFENIDHSQVGKQNINITMFTVVSMARIVIYTVSSREPVEGKVISKAAESCLAHKCWPSDYRPRGKSTDWV